MVLIQICLEKRLKNVKSQSSKIDIVFCVFSALKHEKRGRFSIHFFGNFVNKFVLNLAEKPSKNQMKLKMK